MEIRDRVLVVEDDKRINSFYKAALEANNYDVLFAKTGKEAYSMITSQCPDVVILDLGLPDMDGMTILSKIREWSRMPVIVVSARTHERDKVAALDMGADDYITKPFGLLEFVARVKAVLRRAGNWQEEQEVFSVENICLNEAKHMVYVENKRIELTYKEYELLRIFMKNAGNVMTRELLLERIWGIDYEGESRTLDMHIKTLRKKLGTAGEQIKTIRNVGYRLEK